MTSAVTIVTALYDLKRGEMEKYANNYRPFSDYLNWLKYLLQLNCPIVIYVQPDLNVEDLSVSGIPNNKKISLKTFVEKNRTNNYEITIIEKLLSSFQFYSKWKLIQDIMDRRLIEFPDKDKRIEFVLPDYVIINCSKIDMLKEVKLNNPYQSEYLFWVDAGFQREPWNFNVTLKWPDLNKIKIAQDKILLMEHKIHTYKTDVNQIEYLKACPNDMRGYTFGGHISLIDSFHQEFWTKVEWMLNSNLINNEQQILTLMVFDSWKDKTKTQYVLYPEHSDKRTFLKDFSIRGKLKIPISICPNIEVCTVVTKNIKESQIELWKETATQHGYKYTILARDSEWKGWDFRTKKYLEFLKGVNTEVVALTDSTDVFFTGSAWELYNKFKNMKQNVVIGGESAIAYSRESGKYSHDIIEDYFARRSKSRFAFPNGGLVIGYREELIKVLEDIQVYRDDQAGYFDMIYTNKHKITIDYKTELLGNVPNHHATNKQEANFWKIDPKTGRILNPIHQTTPSIMHFPGGNYNYMKQFNTTSNIAQEVDITFDPNDPDGSSNREYSWTHDGEYCHSNENNNGSNLFLGIMIGIASIIFIIAFILAVIYWLI